MFAVAQVSNIIIFSTYSFQVVTTLKGHSGIVKSLCWSEDDRYIVSAGHEGALYEWEIDTVQDSAKSRKENNVKACAFHSAAYDDKNHIIAAIGNDQKIWCFQKNEFMISVECDSDLTAVSIF